MATLQKFKHLAIQCGAPQSPARSPTVHLRRRKTTLSMLLSRSRRRRESSLRRECLLEKKKSEDQVRQHTLKDLFTSAPPGDEDVSNVNVDTHSVANAKSDISGSGYYGPGSPKHGWTGFRYRSLLSKKAWRPILLSILE